MLAKLMVGTTTVCMVKIYDESLVKLLFNIFQFSLETRNIPSNWKTGNKFLVRKKDNRNLINNCRVVSLLPIFCKFMKSVSMIHFYNYLEGNDLFSKSQSAFRKGDSCVSQLLSIKHKMFKDFDANPSLDTCGIFLAFLKPLIGFGMRH